MGPVAALQASHWSRQGPLLLAGQPQKLLLGDLLFHSIALHGNTKGWEAMFLIRAFGLSRELSTEVGFAFSNNGLKLKDLRFMMKQIM